jgi:hypothetical protein
MGELLRYIKSCEEVVQTHYESVNYVTRQQQEVGRDQSY